eukprot:TRINITY_DN16897_c0_g1_i1.p1 TRINITY_DN16897_c0_g1~~TRINITY_DN16897_c0_g1_i1.p1  ORF type:complete len:514 (-),score=89.64 TRINITY_DN16897_c0_g1_i1:76-1617(-)
MPRRTVMMVFTILNWSSRLMRQQHKAAQQQPSGGEKMDDNIIGFGTGRKCINPEVPVSLGGYFNVRMWDGVLDDIFVHALVMDKNGVSSAIIYFDLLTVTQTMADDIYREISAFGKFGRENVILCASHTHTAPSVNRESAGYNPEYNEWVIRKAVEAFHEALDNPRQGRLFTGMAFNDRLSFNRRFWMKDGSVVTNPGKMNQNIVEPEGLIDPQIPLLRIEQDGQVKVLLASISNHGDTIGGNKVSGDWMGVFRRELEIRLGSGSMCLPLIAPSGNINHFDVTDPRPQTSYTEAKRIGHEYARSVAEALAGMKPADDFNLQTAGCAIRVEPRKIEEAEQRAAEQIVAEYSSLSAEGASYDLTSEDLAKKSPVALKFFADATLRAAQDHSEREFNPVCIDLGSYCILSLPSEVFVEVGMKIRTDIFPDKTVLLATHSGTGAEHLTGGYIPNTFNYGRGGYETTCRANPFEVAAADKLISGIKLLREKLKQLQICLLYTSPSPRDLSTSRMPSSA